MLVAFLLWTGVSRMITMSMAFAGRPPRVVEPGSACRSRIYYFPFEQQAIGPPRRRGSAGDGRSIISIR
jgi:hypothetical protein